MTDQNQKKTIELSPELYDAIQELKKVFTQLTQQPIESDEDVIGILVSGFIESLRQGGVQWPEQGGQGQWWIITE